MDPILEVNEIPNVDNKLDRKRKRNTEVEKEPKKFKKRTTFMNHLDINISNAIDIKEIYRPFSSSFLIRENDKYYIHPIGLDSVDPNEPRTPCIYGGVVGKLNLTPNGPCMNCDIEIKNGRIPSVKKYDLHYKRFTIWGNFCSFGCALRYELEHPNHNTHIIIVWINKLAREVWNYSEIIQPTAPPMFYKKHGGNIDPEQNEEFSRKYYVKVRENFASIPIVGEYLSTEPSSMGNWNLRKICPPLKKRKNEPSIFPLRIPLNGPEKQQIEEPQELIEPPIEKVESPYEKFLRDTPEKPDNLILPINPSNKKKRKIAEPKKKPIEPKPVKKPPPLKQPPPKQPKSLMQFLRPSVTNNSIDNSSV